MLASFISVANADEILLVNTNALGKYISEEISYFSECDENQIYPGYVHTGVYKGKISYITFGYSQEVKFKDIREKINKSYSKYNKADQGPKDNPIAIWHLPDKIEIQMQKNKQGVTELTYATNKSFDW